MGAAALQQCAGLKCVGVLASTIESTVEPGDAAHVCGDGSQALAQLPAVVVSLFYVRGSTRAYLQYCMRFTHMRGMKHRACSLAGAVIETPVRYIFFIF